MASKYLIGLDIGTSGAKCILADDKGAVLASSTQEYPLSTPKPGWAEQNPQDWWDAVVRGLKVILPKANVPKEQIAGVSFSGQMHGLVALDKDLNVIRPAILWCDSRTQKQCDWITEKAGGLSGLLTYTNNQMLAGYTGGKLIWFKQEEPELFAKMTRFICPKDYIRFKVCGELAIDASDASGTGFFNTRERVWADDLIALAGLDKSIFPDVIESTDLAGHVTRACAEGNGPARGPAGLRRRRRRRHPDHRRGAGQARRWWAWSSARPATSPWRWTSISTTPRALCRCSATTPPASGRPSAARCPPAAAIAGTAIRSASI